MYPAPVKDLNQYMNIQRLLLHFKYADNRCKVFKYCLAIKW